MSVSGWLCWACFPPLSWSALVWVALVPWLAGLRRLESAALAAGASLLAGLCFAVPSVYWLCFAHPLGYLAWFALALYLALYWVLAGLILRRTFRWVGPWAPVAVAVVWVGLESTRGWLLGGFPWFYLPHAQYAWPVLNQAAAVVGTSGLSFLIALLNGLWAEWVLWASAIPGALRLGPLLAWTLVGAVLWILQLGYGLWAVRSMESRLESGPRVALVQTNFPQRVREDPAELQTVHERCYELAHHVRALKADLVVWPETTWRMAWIELKPEFPTKQTPQGSVPSREELLALQRFVHQSLANLTGYGPSAHVVGINTFVWSSQGPTIYNSAYFFQNGRVVFPPYHKLYLVPFGEYVPLEKWLPFLRIFSPNTSQSGSLTPGGGPVVFQLGSYRMGPLICFEDTVPSLARVYVRDFGVDFLVNLTNDGWFGCSAENELHLAAAVFRAIECRRSLVRAVNTGVSAIIDPTGQFRAVAGGSPQKGTCVEQLVVGEVPVARLPSLYVAWGDWVGRGTELSTLVLWIFGFLARRRGRG